MEIEYRKGDVILGAEDGYWGKYHSTILALHSSNEHAHCIYSKKKCRINLPVSEIRLIDAEKRPLFSALDAILSKMASRGNMEALRELEIRRNKKKFK